MKEERGKKKKNQKDMQRRKNKRIKKLQESPQ